MVTVTEDGTAGRGEAAGVYYRGETPQTMMRQLEAIRPLLERRPTREALRSLLPPGGARNALDCALWDFEARALGLPAWRIAGLDIPKPLLTTYTIGADTADAMARTAVSYQGAKRLKLKLTGENDVARLRAVRAARPDAWIGIDANQAYDVVSLRGVLPALLEADVQLIEQPVRVGCEHELAGFESPIPRRHALPARAATWSISTGRCSSLRTAGRRSGTRQERCIARKAGACRVAEEKTD